MSAMNPASQRGSARRRAGSHSIPSATGMTPTSSPMSAYPPIADPLAVGVRTAAATAIVLWMPVEVVTPTVYGSPSTQSNGISSVVERRRPRVVGPSASKGTIASSTVTSAMVRSSGCGLRTTTRICPSRNSTRRMSSVSAAGGPSPTRPVIELPDADEGGRDGDQQHDRHQRQQARPPEAPSGRRHRLGAHASSTSKKPLQPSSANSDWWAWNMKRPAWWKSISMMPRSPWHCMTVSVYSKWSVLPVR